MTPRSRQCAPFDGRTAIDLFFRRFASWIAQQLNLPDDVDKFWNGGFSNSQTCTRYVEQRILEPLVGACVVAIDEADVIFQTDFSQDFFTMLRSWHNNRAYPMRRSWKKLDRSTPLSTHAAALRPHRLRRLRTRPSIAVLRVARWCSSPATSPRRRPAARPLRPLP